MKILKILCKPPHFLEKFCSQLQRFAKSAFESIIISMFETPSVRRDLPLARGTETLGEMKAFLSAFCPWFLIGIQSFTQKI
jgi:hypothetical protein